MTTTKKIELRKVTYAAALSEETSAYSAQVWVDDVHVCDVTNHGHGGCDEQHPARGKTRADIDALDAYIKATFPAETTDMMLHGKPFVIEPDLEHLCGKLLDRHLIGKDLQRTLKRTVAYFDPKRKAILTFKGKHSDAERAFLANKVMREHPDARVLNALPFADALALYAEHAR